MRNAVPLKKLKETTESGIPESCCKLPQGIHWLIWSISVSQRNESHLESSALDLKASIGRNPKKELHKEKNFGFKGLSENISLVCLERTLECQRKYLCHLIAN